MWRPGLVPAVGDSRHGRVPRVLLAPHVCLPHRCPLRFSMYLAGVPSAALSLGSGCKDWVPAPG